MDSTAKNTRIEKGDKHGGLSFSEGYAHGAAAAGRPIVLVFQRLMGPELLAL
jgi:hypothetical protein